VIGFGDQRPVQGNDTPQGRNANRRVVVVILSTELMRHNDPTELPAPPAAWPSEPATPTPKGVDAAIDVLADTSQPQDGGTVPAR
jgi:chemotaxis protein MotB